MKCIFYIDMLFNGGAQRVMANLCNGFIGLGHEIILINDYPAPQNIVEFPIDKKVRREYLCKDNRGNSIIKNFFRIKRLRRIIMNEDPDIVLSFRGLINYRMLLATIGLCVFKVVSVRNDPYKEYGDTWLQKTIARSLFKLADGCVFQTKQASEYFTVDIIRKSKIIYNPVAEKFYQANINENRKDIISVGRLAPQKNHKLLIEAFSKIANKFPNENLIIYGEGPLRIELEKLIIQLGLVGRVFLPGEVKDIVSKLVSCKLFVLSSDFEGMPNALMEAMTVGVPCIATDCPCGGPKMLIDDDKNGFLVPVVDVQAMAIAMEKLLGDEKLRKNIGDVAKASAEAFKSDVVLKQWEKYLEKVVQSIS